NNMLKKGVIQQQKAFGTTFDYYSAKMMGCCRKRNKVKIQQQEEGLELAKKKIDIMYILKKLQEFEKLKYVMLDTNQRALFDYIPPPLVAAKDSQDKNKQHIKKDILNAIKYYDPKNELMEKYKTAESIMELYKVYKDAKHGDTLSRKLVDML